MICVLDVTAGPARGRRFWIRNNQRVEIGRVSTADFAVPTDPHMSRRHMILEGTLSAFRIRDVGSANGTFVNNAKVSAVELCSGDRIRAGETTFEVSVLDDDDNPHAKDGFTFSSSSTDSKGEAWLPVRSLAAEAAVVDEVSESDQDSTQRCTPEMLRAQLDAQDAEFLLESKSPISTSVKRHDSSVARRGTVHSNCSWWMEYSFQVSEVPCLLHQPASRHDGACMLPEILKRVEPDFTLTAIVNVERLGRFSRQLLGVMVERGGVTWHSPAVCSILDDRSRDFLRMAESALTHDALMLLGARTALDHAWLDQVISIAARPSTLGQLLRDPSSDLTNQLLSVVEFVIFEFDRQGRLSLLLRDLVEQAE